MDIGELNARAGESRARLDAARQTIGDGIAWYPYDILGNLPHLDALLTGANRDLSQLVGDLPVADIGGADGDLAFVLEHECGWKLQMIDNAPTNMNGLNAARTLREQLRSTIEIHDIDLDAQFRLPSERYGLVLLLGILYHLQNPFYVLRELSRRADHLVLSTRVARYAGSLAIPIGDLPVAYLVGPSETNNDATNYWMFSPAGLDRIVERAGWIVLESGSFGDITASDPSSPEHDERRFLLLRSKQATERSGTAAQKRDRVAPPTTGSGERTSERSGWRQILFPSRRLG